MEHMYSPCVSRKLVGKSVSTLQKWEHLAPCLPAVAPPSSGIARTNSTCNTGGQVSIRHRMGESRSSPELFAVVQNPSGEAWSA
jgi:hypothetical protein